MFGRPWRAPKRWCVMIGWGCFGLEGPHRPPETVLFAPGGGSKRSWGDPGHANPKLRMAHMPSLGIGIGFGSVLGRFGVVLAWFGAGTGWFGGLVFGAMRCTKRGFGDGFGVVCLVRGALHGPQCLVFECHGDGLGMA